MNGEKELLEAYKQLLTEVSEAYTTTKKQRNFLFVGVIIMLIAFIWLIYGY